MAKSLDLILGIDIGGTYIRIVLFRINDNKVIAHNKFIFIENDDSLSEFKINVIDNINNTLEKFENIKLVGIGISSAPMFERSSGRIISWPNNKKWNGLDLKKMLMDAYKVYVHIEDDANSAAFFEKKMGRTQDYSNFAYITISTGIGCGLIINNSLFIGNNGFAGEIGHIKINNNRRKCKCGKEDCLQMYASGKAMAEQYNEMTGEMVTPCRFIELANQNNETACRIINNASIYIKKMIEIIVEIFDISVFVLGGGVIKNYPKMRGLIIEKLDNEKKIKHKIELLDATNDEFNGAIGVALLTNTERIMR